MRFKNSTVTRGWVEWVDEKREPVRITIGFSEQAKAERALGSKAMEGVVALTFMTRLALIKSGDLPADTTQEQFEDVVAGMAMDEDEQPEGDEPGEPMAPCASSPASPSPASPSATF